MEAIGPLQAQAWAAPPAALASRIQGFEREQLHAALDAGELVIGTLMRTTIHIVSAREHPAYAAVASEAQDWRRTGAERTPESDGLARDLRDFAREPRTGEEIAAFAEEWVQAHPGAVPDEEVERQRELKWRPLQRSCAFVRVPADGRWGAKAPAALRAAPAPAPDPADALAVAVQRHLRAFGPATAEDVASFLGRRTPPVRAALDGLELERLDDLYDLPDAPRPDPDTPAPPRLLAAFDSALLAYVSKRRQRIIADEHRDAVYERRNLQVRPTFLLDGMVAGTWSIEVKRRVATVTLKPFKKLRARKELFAEAELVARALHPDAKGHEVSESSAG